MTLVHVDRSDDGLTGVHKNPYAHQHRQLVKLSEKQGSILYLKIPFNLKHDVVVICTPSSVFHLPSPGCSNAYWGGIPGGISGQQPHKRTLQPSPPTAPTPSRLGLRARVDHHLRNDGLRGPPRNNLRDPPHTHNGSSLVPNVVHDAVDPQLPLDAVVLRCAETWVGPCGYRSSGRYGRETDGNVVGYRSHCVLDMLPYAGWLCFATYLNVSVGWLNKWDFDSRDVR